MLLLVIDRWGALRQQAITWANVDPDLCHHMASLGNNELKQVAHAMYLHPCSTESRFALNG